MKYVVLVITLVLLVYLVMEFNSRTAELNRLVAQRDAVSARLNSRLQTQAALKQELAYATSDRAVEQFAREHNMARDGDVPVVPLAPYQSTPTPPPTPEPAPVEAMNNWQRWLALFIDPTPMPPGGFH